MMNGVEGYMDEGLKRLVVGDEDGESNLYPSSGHWNRQARATDSRGAIKKYPTTPCDGNAEKVKQYIQRSLQVIHR